MNQQKITQRFQKIVKQMDAGTLNDPAAAFAEMHQLMVNVRADTAIAIFFKGIAEVSLQTTIKAVAIITDVETFIMTRGLEQGWAEFLKERRCERQ
jgi:hypothetical protein